MKSPKRILKKSNNTGTQSLEYQKNEVRLKLLVALPQFQDDVRKIRRDLGIPESGFNNSDAFRAWKKNELNKTDRIMNRKSFLGKEGRIMDLDNYSERLKQKWELEDEVPIFRRGHRQRMLGEKYMLPENFYEDTTVGIFPYITLNRIIPPVTNWDIQLDPDGRVGTTRWLAIKTYARLSETEFNEAKEELASLQKHYFPKGLTINSRTKRQFDRDLQIYEELTLKRGKKPVRKKLYTGYLDLIKNPEERRRLEKFHPGEVCVSFDEKTSREVAKRHSTTSNAVRKAMERINKLIENFFGGEYVGR